MSDSPKTSQNTEDYGYVVAGNKAGPVEFIRADEFKARPAANDTDYDDNTAGTNTTVKAEEVNPVKKKKKPKSKKPKPTGFEEYHADAPLTPAEYAEEQNLYDRYVCPQHWTALSCLLTFFGSLDQSLSQRLSILPHPEYIGRPTGAAC
jgi:hypothetical protein